MKRASVRYRGLYPALALTRLGHQVRIFDHALSKREIKKFDCIIIVKSWTPEDLKVARLARSESVPFVVDLCDNIFIHSYGSGVEASRFGAIARLSGGVITTGPALAERARAALPHLPIFIISDPLERASDNAELERLFDAELAFARRRRHLLLLKRFLLMPPVYAAQVARYHLWPATAAAARGDFGRLLMMRERAADRLGRLLPKILALWPIRYALDVLRLHIVPALGDAIKGDLRRCNAVVQAARAILLRTPRTVTLEREARTMSAVPALDPRTPKASTRNEVHAGLSKVHTGVSNAPAATSIQGNPLRTVIWFGNHGAPYGDFGIRNILIVAPALARLSREIPIRLLVISNNRHQYEELIRPLPFPSEYREWRQERIFTDIAEADVCIVPNSRDAFSICKSANRIVLSLACGTPVVATSTPASDALAPYVIFDDWDAGLRTYLSDPDRVHRDVTAGQDFIRAAFTLDVLGKQWSSLLHELKEHQRCSSSSRSDHINLLFFMDLVQDLDVIEPVLRGALADPRFNVTVCVTQWLIRVSPRSINRLTELGVLPEIVEQMDVTAGLGPALDDVDCLLTASESTAAPHRIPFALVQRSNARNILTATMQHGLENTGLTYQDPTYRSVDFGSKRLFTWGDPKNLPNWVRPEVRARCVGVGCPKPAHVKPIAYARQHARLIAIFENLHWERYSERYVSSFLADLSDTIDSFADTEFLIKPHHAGRWLTKNPDALRPRPNLTIADPRAPEWEPYTAGAIIEIADAAITTPSTVALDAVRAGKAVAVAGYDLDLPVYDPLPILRSKEDWRDFLAGLPERARHQDRFAAFLQRHVLSGNPVRRILDFIAAEFNQGTRGPGRALRSAAAALHDGSHEH
jgi:glycosyltransferase involved in cell wall biosynthesis